MTTVQPGRSESLSPEDPGSLEGQLHELYAQRERLAAALGTADADELIGLVEDLRHDTTRLDESLVAQVEALYAERDQLQTAIGVSSADDILALVESLRQPSQTTITTGDDE